MNLSTKEYAHTAGQAGSNRNALLEMKAYERHSTRKHETTLDTVEKMLHEQTKQ